LQRWPDWWSHSWGPKASPSARYGASAFCGFMARARCRVSVVLHEAHKRQVEETAETLGEGPERFYNNHLD
jgi:hypothetical protein